MPAAGGMLLNGVQVGYTYTLAYVGRVWMGTFVFASPVTIQPSGTWTIPQSATQNQAVAVSTAVAAQPAAVATAVWTLASAIDGKTPQQALQIIAAALAGTNSGVGTGTETYKGLDGLTSRLVAVVDALGTRTGMTYP